MGLYDNSLKHYCILFQPLKLHLDMRSAICQCQILSLLPSSSSSQENLLSSSKSPLCRAQSHTSPTYRSFQPALGGETGSSSESVLSSSEVGETERKSFMTTSSSSKSSLGLDETDSCGGKGEKDVDDLGKLSSGRMKGLVDVLGALVVE